MKNYLYLVVLTCLLFSARSLQAQCDDGRYFNKIFSTQISNNVTYGSAVRYNGDTQTLRMNIYQPSGDDFAHRPLIMLAFGGSFTSGVKESPDLLVLCDEFTRRGYVCASIDYRLGFEDGNDSDTNQFKAVIRGVQDMRAAVRFFYKDAYTANNYRIDTNQIFIGGVSAGGFIALNYAYAKLDTFSRQLPPFVPNALIEVGGLIGTSGNPGYSDKVKGVIDLCGAIADTVWIMPNDPILVGVHGTADDLVRCDYDSLYATTTTESSFYGGCDIKNRIENIGITSSFRLFQGAGHVPFVLPSTPYLPPSKQYMDTTVLFLRDFLFANTECDSTRILTGIGNVEADISVALYPNPAEGAFNIASAHDKVLVADVYSVEGKLVSSKLVYPRNLQAFERSEIGAGLFVVKLSDWQSGQQLKTLKAVMY